jgi:hypothetical protein
MSRFLLATCILAPMGLGLLLRHFGMAGSAILYVFLPLWAVLFLREVDWRFRQHLPRRSYWFLATWGYAASVLGVLLGFWWLHPGLPEPSFSFLLGVSHVDLWFLLAVLLFTTKPVARLLPEDRLWSLPFVALLLLGVDVAAHLALFHPSTALSLPVTAGALSGLFVTLTAMLLLSEH